MTAARSPVYSVALLADSLTLNGGTIASPNGPPAQLGHAGATKEGPRPPAGPSLTAQWTKFPPGHSGDGMKFVVRVKFSEPVTAGAQSLRNHALTVTDGRHRQPVAGRERQRREGGRPVGDQGDAGIHPAPGADAGGHVELRRAGSDLHRGREAALQGDIPDRARAGARDRGGGRGGAGGSGRRAGVRRDVERGGALSGQGRLPDGGRFGHGGPGLHGRLGSARLRARRDVEDGFRAGARRYD